MRIESILLLVWLVVVGFWGLNHFFNSNKKYEQEYKAGKHRHSREG